jgi:hypothetical protein
MQLMHIVPMKFRYFAAELIVGRIMHVQFFSSSFQLLLLDSKGSYTFIRIIINTVVFS